MALTLAYPLFAIFCVPTSVSTPPECAKQLPRDAHGVDPGAAAADTRPGAAVCIRCLLIGAVGGVRRRCRQDATKPCGQHIQTCGVEQTWQIWFMHTQAHACMACCNWEELHPVTGLAPVHPRFLLYRARAWSNIMGWVCGVLHRACNCMHTCAMQGRFNVATTLAISRAHESELPANGVLLHGRRIRAAPM